MYVTNMHIIIIFVVKIESFRHYAALKQENISYTQDKYYMYISKNFEVVQCARILDCGC